MTTKILFMISKIRIQQAQIKAALSVNRELLNLYWDLGKRIVEKQKETAWGDYFIKQLSVDLQNEFPNMKGFSIRNLALMRQWFVYWSSKSEFVQQLVAQIPWGHNALIIS